MAETLLAPPTTERGLGLLGDRLAVFRIAFGLYFAVLFARLLPWAEKMYSAAGMLPDAALSPLHGKVPNPLFTWDSPLALQLLCGGLVLLSLCYAVGLRYRLCAVLMWAGWTFLWQRNPFTLNPSMPFNGWLMLATVFLPARPPWSLDRLLAGPDPSRPARVPIPPDVVRAAWIVMAVAYSWSGWTKLLSAGWRSGEAVGLILDGPLARPAFWVDGLRAAPAWLWMGLTWATLGLELLFAPLCLFRRGRMLAWGGMVGMHVGLVFVIQFAELSLGMMLIHLLTFDPAWLRRPPAPRPAAPR